ncbi:MAG TPA: preprotein translocase subunit SecE [Acidimicrobiales bacterium]|nr:preprotein translocase subunit SecE [Acidimicrobiales bacterium]
MDSEGSPTRREAPRPPAARVATKERIGPSEYARQVRGELRKVAWPTRPEVINYTIVVLIALVLLTSIIFGLDYVFAKAVIFLFK